MTDSSRQGIRWWPLVAIWFLAIATIGLFFGLHDADSQIRQALVMKLIGIALGAVSLSVLWLLAFSRLAARTRLGFLGAVALFGSIFVLLFRFGGVSGDLVPIFTWRWTKTAVAKSEGAEGSETIARGSFNQFLGPKRNATIPGIRLGKDWSETPPRLLWKMPVGEAWSGFAVAHGKAITQEQAGEEELVSCYDLGTGKLVWQKRNQARYENPLGGVGPRATPTIDGDQVYTIGATGYFACRSLETGELKCAFNLLENHGAPLPEWGVAGSPLVLERQVILSAGGKEGNSLVAYDKISGELVWRGGDDRAHWSSPVVHEVHGQPQVLIFNKSGVAAHSVEDGTVLWEFPWTRSTGTPRVSVPVALPGNRFVISSGYGAGASLFQVLNTPVGFVAEEEWRSLHLKSKFNNFVFKDGYLYGLDDGMLTCIDAETGRRSWKKGRYGHGQLLLGDDWLLLLAENGEAVLLEPDPEGPVVLGTFPALEGKSWNPPALVGPYLLVRNHLEAACYRLPLEE